jgi:hypothetical protein
VFQTASAAGLQVRELGVRRESIEAAFLRVLGNAPASRERDPYRTPARASGHSGSLGRAR